MVDDADWAAGGIVTAQNLQDLTPGLNVWTPTWINVTLGTAPTNSGHWWQIGLEVNFTALFILGTGGDVTGTIELDLTGLPAIDGGLTSEIVVSAIAADADANPRVSGHGFNSGSTTRINRFCDDATAIGWSAAQPFDWVASCSLRVQGRYLTSP